MNDDQIYVCENCGQATTVADDTCPSCGAPMEHIGVKVKADDGDDSAELTDAEIAAGADEGTLSLDALREEEDEDDDRDAYERGEN